ncbi:hypothetical protein Lal_00011284 [Lupinus albus]|nr:hypothetical protein Lal_00011284 [Lupinus albus]
MEIDHRIGWNVVWLECDFPFVVDIFNEKAKAHWKFLSRWILCKNLILSMIFKVSHIYREGNSYVDKLANFGIYSKTYTWWNSKFHLQLFDCGGDANGIFLVDDALFATTSTNIFSPR